MRCATANRAVSCAQHFGHVERAAAILVECGDSELLFFFRIFEFKIVSTCVVDVVTLTGVCVPNSYGRRVLFIVLPAPSVRASAAARSDAEAPV